MHNTYYVYILFNKPHGTLYTGVTNSLPRYARNDTWIMKKYLILTTFYLLLMGCARDVPCDPSRDHCALTSRGGEIYWAYVAE